MKNSYLINAVFILGALVSFSCRLHSQDETVLIYHGGNSRSGIIAGNNPQEKAHVEVQSKYKMTQNKNDVVRIEVWNPNPYFYKYSIKTKNVDPPKPPAELGGLSAITNAVVPSGIIPKSETRITNTTLLNNVGISVNGPDATIEKNIIAPLIDEYKKAFEHSKTILNEMIKIINDSKDPESVNKPQNPDLQVSAGFYVAKRKFNDTMFNGFRRKDDFSKILDAEFQKLSDTLLIKLRESKIKDPSNEKVYTELESFYTDLILPALKEYPKIVMGEAHQKVIEFIDTPETPIYFDVVVPAEGIEIDLIAHDIRMPNKHRRDTAIIGHVSITTEYERPVLEIVPLLYMVSKPNTKSFSIKDSTVIETQGDYFDFRIGSVLMMNFFTWDSFALGIGVGSNLGIGTEWNVDLLAIVGLSYRDWLRVGVGFSRAFIPSKLKNYTSENNSLPNYADETDMNDLIIKEPFGTLVFTLSFTGIGL